MKQFLILKYPVGERRRGSIITIKDPGYIWTKPQQAEYYDHLEIELNDHIVNFIKEFIQTDVFLYHYPSSALIHKSGIKINDNLNFNKTSYEDVNEDEVADKFNPFWRDHYVESFYYLNQLCFSSSSVFLQESFLRPYRSYWLEKFLYFLDQEDVKKLLWGYFYGKVGTIVQTIAEMPDGLKKSILDSTYLTNSEKTILNNIWSTYASGS